MYNFLKHIKTSNIYKERLIEISYVSNDLFSKLNDNHFFVLMFVEFGLDYLGLCVRICSHS